MKWHHAARGLLLCGLPCLFAASGVAIGIEQALDPDPRFATLGSHIIFTAARDLFLFIVLVPAVGALGDVLSRSLALWSASAMKACPPRENIGTATESDLCSAAMIPRSCLHPFRVVAEDLALTSLSAVLALLVLTRWPDASALIPWLAIMYAVFLGIRITPRFAWARSRLHHMQIEQLFHRPGYLWNWHKTYLLAEVGILSAVFIANVEIRDRAAHGSLGGGFLPPEISSAIPLVGPTLAAMGPLPFLILFAIAAILPISAGFSVLGLLADGLCYGMRRFAHIRWPVMQSLAELGITMAVINGAYIAIGLRDIGVVLAVVAGSIGTALLIGALLQGSQTAVAHILKSAGRTNT